VTLIVEYLPGMKPSDDGTIHRGLLNIIEKAYADESLHAALMQLTQSGCRCSEAQSCLVSLPLISAILVTSDFRNGFLEIITCTHAHTHTHSHFTALLIVSRTTQASRYQKKYSPTHTYRGHQSSLICFLHLLRSMASSLFYLCASA